MLRAYLDLSNAQLQAKLWTVPILEKIGPPLVFVNAQIIIARPQLGAITVDGNETH